MKKTAIWASLFTLISTSHPALADSKPVVEKPAAPQTTSAPESTAESSIPAATTPQPPAKLDCNYLIPADQKNVDQTLVMKWAQNATMQTFSFSHDQIDDQMKALENCFTKQGWKSFSEALNKSGNLKTIKSDNLTVSATVKNQPQMVENTDSQWKVNFPMAVVYQNDQEKLTQDLDISVLVGRKTTGGLGIMQLVATPKQKMNQSQTSAADTQQPETKQN